MGERLSETVEAIPAAAARLDRCRAALWDQPAQQLVVANRKPREILEALVEADHLADAIRFFAMALPKQSSIWWGTLCAWNAYGDELAGNDLAALEATVLWLRNPSEANRRAAEVAGKRASVRRPAGALAMAAFMGEGSISRPDLPFVAPGPPATGRLVAGAVLLAAVLREPIQYRERYRQYLTIGLEVADGHLGWLTTTAEPESGAAFRVETQKSSVPAPHFAVDLHHHACQAVAPREVKSSSRQDAAVSLKNPTRR